MGVREERAYFRYSNVGDFSETGETNRGIQMRKALYLAIAGFIWRQLQKRWAQRKFDRGESFRAARRSL